jgi:hypothetical protein
MSPVVNKDDDTDESYSWADVVKTPSGQSRYRNVPQFVDPSKTLVSDTLQDDGVS